MSIWMCGVNIFFLTFLQSLWRLHDFMSKTPIYGEILARQNLEDKLLELEKNDFEIVMFPKNIGCC